MSLRFRVRHAILIGAWIVGTAIVAVAQENPATQPGPWVVDFRYAPPWWQTSICLPDDWQKTLVAKDGGLLYDYPGKYAAFKTKITAGLDGPTQWVRQELISPRVPIVRTIKRNGPVELVEEAFAVVPTSRPAADAEKPQQPPRNDVTIIRLRNTGSSEVTVDPTLAIESEQTVTPDGSLGVVSIGVETILVSTLAPKRVEESAGRLTLHFGPVTMVAGGQYALAVEVARGKQASRTPAQNVSQAEQLRQLAEDYWRKLDLPYGHIEVPDAGIQGLFDSSIRNIYQAREIKKGLPAFQVGPTCYRGLWVVDGSFLMEAVAYLGRLDEARDGIRYLLSFQREDGAFLLMDGHWKETGIALWSVARHARLTNDKAWLREVWPRVERGFAFIRKMRQTASADPQAPNAGLIPDGMSDGGLGGKYPEYTNVYWTLAGMRAAIEAARWLDQDDQAKDWQREYDDFYATFRRAAERDTRTDTHGNRFLPIRMRDDQNVSPQKAQWAFLHAIFPGKVFAADDSLVRGNMAMLRAVEQEGLVFDTGWVANGIWNYFGSFYAHAWLWLGQGPKAAETLYAFANHASPLLAWREEQMPIGKPPQYIGDMPHNWASAEFVRLVRHLLVLERGDQLHLFEGLPKAWVRPGAITKLQGIVTEFGPMSLELHLADDGSSAHLRMTPPTRSRPAKIVLHLEGWSPHGGQIELPTTGQVDRDMELKTPASGQR